MSLSVGRARSGAEVPCGGVGGGGARAGAIHDIRARHKRPRLNLRVVESNRIISVHVESFSGHLIGHYKRLVLVNQMNGLLILANQVTGLPTLANHLSSAAEGRS
jgi:hypothetical protein